MAWSEAVQEVFQGTAENVKNYLLYVVSASEIKAPVLSHHSH